MTPKNPSRFDTETLRKIAGDKIFKRGEDYYRNGRVTILDASPKRILAEVTGSEDYRVTLTGHGTTIDGECSCPNYEMWNFCKHMVAVALAAGAPDNTEPDGGNAFARIRAYLEAQNADALISLILNLAEHDSALFRKLDTLSLATGKAGKDAAKGLRLAIDRATRITGFLDYADVPAWSGVIDELLETLAALTAAGQAALVPDLALHAIDRLEQAQNRIDDSAGYCGELLHRAGEIHLEAAEAVRPAPVKLAQLLFTREMEETSETFFGAARRYATVLGEPGMREYRRLAREQWDKLPPSGKAPQSGYSATGNHFRLFHILDFFAEGDGDTDMRIALRCKDLSSSWRYLQLAEFCHEQGREAEALQRAEEGLWLFEDDHPDERLLDFTADLLVKKGRAHEAEAHLWRAFEKRQSLALYEKLRKIAGEPAYERATGIVRKRLPKGKQFSWYNPTDLLIRIAMRERHFGAAWDMTREHGASMDTLESLARASEAGFPREALGVYIRRVDQLAEGGQTSFYEKAAALLGHMAGLRSDTEHAAHIADLKVRFRRKRNFMKLLG